jgi:hypothetical protein
LGQRHEWDDIIQRGIKEMVYEDADWINVTRDNVQSIMLLWERKWSVEFHKILAFCD